MKTVLDFAAKKNKKEKISMVTCYDHGFAKILSTSNIDTILVGDSLAQVIHGYPNTLHATIEMMALHTAAVARGAPNKFIVADMPFMSTRKGLESTMNDVQKLMLAGAHAIKIENADGHADLIKHIVESGVPVMGHLGLTPQSIHQLGGPKIQGRTQSGAEKLLSDASILQQAGCFALVLELIPTVLAEKVTQSLSIPTIGIGAGVETDGQVLVLNDMLGMNPNFNPKFLKKYSTIHDQTLMAVNQYVIDVTAKSFPKPENAYD
jgi:3-methyl-2-oxobutanoate hydroxymethyltransferase